MGHNFQYIRIFLIIVSALAACNQTPTTDLLALNFPINLYAASPSVTLNTGESKTINVIGGTKPYKFTMVNGKGSVTSAGEYTAPTTGGLEVVKVTDAVGSNLFVTFRIMIPLLAPDAVTGLNFWVKGDAGVSTTGAAVDTWADQSGNGNNLTGTGGNRPLYSAAAMGGRPGISFTQASSHFLTFANSGFVAGSYSIFIVYNIATCGGSNAHMLGGTVSATSQNFYIGYSSCTTLLHGYYTYELFAYHTAAGTPEILFVSHDRSNLSTNIMVNGVTKSSGPMAVNYPGGSVTGLALGRFTTFYYNGTISEMMIYDNVLSNQSREGIHCSLAKKYGITMENCK